MGGKIKYLLVSIFILIIGLPPLVAAQYYPLSQFTVNVNINVPGAGRVTPGSGLYFSGASIVFYQYTNPGFSFDGWYVDGVYQGKLASISLTMTQDYQLTASFSKRVTVLSIAVNPETGGTTAPGMGVWNYTYGDNVVIKQFPNSGATFQGWYLDGTYQGLGTSITVNMNQDHQLNAFFSGAQIQTPTPTVMPTPTLLTPTPSPSPTPVPILPTPDLQFYCYSSTSASGFNVKIQGSLAYNGTPMTGAGILLSYSVTGGATWHELAYVTTGEYGDFQAVWMPSASGQYLIKATWPSDKILSTASQTVSFAVTPSATEDSSTEDQSMFSVTSNSTLTQLTFNSVNQELNFGVSGPSGTIGYVQVCIPKTLL